METKALTTYLTDHGFGEDFIDKLLAHGHHRPLKKDEVLIAAGSAPHTVPMVLGGVLKVMRHDEEGHELFLYYLESGDACAMSIACCIDHFNGDFEVRAECEAEVFTIPFELIDEAIARYTPFRHFVFKAYRERFMEMLETIDSLAFMPMEERLMKYLLDSKQSSGNFVIEKTHRQIAHELNTSRVVVSRLLKKLEREEKIELHRNRIEIL